MLSAGLLTTLVLFSSQITSTLAAPTRTHCQCKIVSNTDSLPPPSLQTPSADHWTPTSPSKDGDDSPSLIPVSINVCATLGSELEKFQHTEPELYELYMRGASSRSRSSRTQTSPDASILDEKPIPTTILLSNSRQQAMHDYAAPYSNEAKAQTHQIVCYAEAPSASSSSHDFHSSPLTLWALQLIVLLTIIACVVEALHMLRTCIQNYTSPADPAAVLPPSKSLRLAGAERRLLAIPSMNMCAEDAMCSPGAEKKLRAYETVDGTTTTTTTRYFAYQGRGGRREFIAYDDDSDDEVNRPVM